MSTVPVVPQEFAGLAAQARLGEFHRFHQARNPMTALVCLGLLTLFFGGILTMFLVVLNDPAEPVTNPYAVGYTGLPAPKNDAGPIPGIVMGVLTALCLAVLLLLLFTRTPAVSARGRLAGIYQFEHGFVHALPRRAEAVRWDDVKTFGVDVLHGDVSGVELSQGVFTVVLTSGRKINLSRYSADMAAFGPVLAASVAGVHVPRALADIDAGRTVSFGRFTVSEDGVATGDKLVPWSDVRGIRVLERTVAVLGADGRPVGRQARIGFVPNVYTLHALVRQMVAKVR